MKNILKKTKIIYLLTGTYLGVLLGSAAASGQEMLQYYVPHGWNMFFMALVFIAVIAITNAGCAYVGKNKLVSKGSEFLVFFCGKFIGKLFDYYFIFFYYWGFVVMCAGGGATLNQEYNIPNYIGVIIICILIAITVIAGLNKLVDIIGSITPFITVFIIVVLIIAMIPNINNIPENINLINSKNVEVLTMNDNWFLSEITHSGCCVCLITSFSTSLALEYKNKHITISGFLSSVIYMILSIIVSFSLLANFEMINGSQLPNLLIVTELWAPLGNIFSILILLGIYTTATPLLWTCINRFAKEKTIKYFVLLTVSCIGAILIATYIPFNMLLHYIFIINGYIGIAIFIIMIIRMPIILIKTKNHVNRRKIKAK